MFKKLLLIPALLITFVSSVSAVELWPGYPLDLSAVGIDYTHNYSSLAAAVTAIGATEITLRVAQTETIADGVTVTIPSTMVLEVMPGGLIQGTAGGGTETLAVNGGLLADDYQQIFGDNLTVTLGTNIGVVYPEWRGCTIGGVAATNRAALTLTMADMATNGGILAFGPGTYTGDLTAIAMPADFTMRGAGKGVTTLATWNFTTEDKSNITVRDLSITQSNKPLQFDGTGDNTACNNLLFENIEVTAHTDEVTYPSPRGLEFEDCSDVRVINSDFYENQYGIMTEEQDVSPNAAQGNARFTITGCKFINNTSLSYPAGIDIVSGVDIKIDKCYFDYNTASNDGYGVYQGDNTTQTSHTIKVTNSYFTGSENADIRIGVASDLVITGNTSESNLTFLRVNGVVLDPVVGTYTNNVVVSNNILDSQILLNNLTYGYVITDNIIDGAAYGIRALGTDTSNRIHNLEIHGNTIKNINDSGIVLQFVDDAVISYNRIIDVNLDDTAAGTSTKCPSVSLSTANKVQIHHNIFENTGATGAHDGAANAATLTDSGESWAIDRFIGKTVHNETDVSSCVITDNDGTTVTCTLTGGTDNDWDIGDTFTVGGYAEYGIQFGTIAAYPEAHYFSNQFVNMGTSHYRGAYSAAPTAGSWEEGDFVEADEFLGTPSRGWINTVAGAPGTWRETGMLFIDATCTWDPASLIDGAGETKVCAVTGAELGDIVIVAPPYDLQDQLFSAYVQAADTVEIRLQNESTATIDLASGAWAIRVIKF